MSQYKYVGIDITKGGVTYPCGTVTSQRVVFDNEPDPSLGWTHYNKMWYEKYNLKTNDVIDVGDDPKANKYLSVVIGIDKQKVFQKL